MRIFTQYIDTKFINSLADLQQADMQIASANILQNLYKIHYVYNFDTYFFCASLIDNEIHQFITEFAKQKTIIVYHPDKVLDNIISVLPDSCRHISHQEHKKTIVIPYLVNSHIFMQYAGSIPRRPDILCFLDNYASIPDRLVSLLYPNSRLPIKVFSKYIQHPQNLGILNEYEKAKLLNNTQYYLNLDTQYEVEAAMCGAVVVDIVDEQTIQPIKPNSLSPYQTYQEFLSELL
jgi:hypothetical protein